MAWKPSKSSRRAMGRAFTQAVVKALETYGPHAFGFALFVIPAVGFIGLAFLFLGEQMAVQVTGLLLSLGLGVLLRAAWAGRPFWPRRKD
jgi:hypothetical protein